jgi:hypothetical protein
MSYVDVDLSSRCVREAHLLFRNRVGVREGMESRTHLNMRPQIRHILEGLL